ncbi:MAG: hypothetical protein DRQ55_18340 [Planctomycetota bacterium]|nr:MAG: hypothetical protein DRQ55_18340 [Planctomycetota bacterium]
MVQKSGAIIGGAMAVIGIALVWTGVPGTLIYGIGVSMIIGGAVSLAGALLAPQAADPSKSRKGSHGIDQGLTTAYEGRPRFYVLGERKVTGIPVSVTTEQDGKKQWIKVLYYVGEGGEYGIESLADHKLGDQNADHYKDVTFTERLGTSGQTAIKGFEKTGTPQTVGVKLDKDDYWTWTTKKPVDEVALAFAWLGGLYDIDSSGVDQANWECGVKWRENDGDDWTYLKPDVNSDWYKSAKSPYSWKASGTTQGVKRKILRIEFPTTATRTIQIHSIKGDSENARRSPTILRIEEIVDDARTFAGSVIIGMRARATGLLAGQLPHMTVVQRGWKVWNQNDTEAGWTRNPSKLVQAVLLDPTDGCGDWFEDTDIDGGIGGTFRTVAGRCNSLAALLGDHADAHWQLDYIVDVAGSAEDHIGHMLATFRARLIEWGGIIRIVQDVASASTRTFDARQSGSGRPILALGSPDEPGPPDAVEAQTPAEAIATHVKAHYTNRDDNYLRRVTEEFVSTEWSPGDPVVRNELQLYGVSRETQAIRECRYFLNRARLRPINSEFGIGWGDFDILPMDVVTVYLDYPTWDGKLFQVEAIQYDSVTGKGRIVGSEYDAGVYDDTSDELPAKVKSLTYAEALKRANQIPRGASSVKVTEVKGSTHLAVSWDSPGDAAMKFQRVYFADTLGDKGKLQAEVDPDERDYLIRDVTEGEYWIYVLTVSYAGNEEDYKATKGKAHHVVTRLKNYNAPSALSEVAAGKVSLSMGVSVSVDPPDKTDPPQKIEIIKGDDEFVGQLVGTVDVDRSGARGEGGQRQASVTLPAAPGRRTGGGDETLILRGVDTEGRMTGAATTRTTPHLDYPNHNPIEVSSIVGDSLTNVTAPATASALEIDATDGVRLREIPTIADITTGNGWGSPDSGLLTDVPMGCRYLPEGTIYGTIVDLGAEMTFVLEVYDEAQRESAAGYLATMKTRYARWPLNPSVEPESRNVPLGPWWANRYVRGDGKPLRPLQRTLWGVRVSNVSDHSGVAWVAAETGMMFRGRYVQIRMTLKGPLGLHQVICPRAYARAWVPISDDGILLNIETTGSNYTVEPGIGAVIVTATATVTLPNAGGNEGKVIHVKSAAAGAIVTVNTNGENIDGDASQLVDEFEGITVASDDTTWWVL